jgi:hypothetical protein
MKPTTPTGKFKWVSCGQVVEYSSATAKTGYTFKYIQSQTNLGGLITLTEEYFNKCIRLGSLVKL